jgi:hypothetical protein
MTIPRQRLFALSALGLSALIAILGPVAPAAAQEPGAEAAWRWIVDPPGRASPDSAAQLERMPPGWHLTTGPAAIVFDPARRASGRFTLQAEMFVFPQTQDDGYGLFLGGHALGTDSARYIAVLLRADGSVSVEQRNGRKAAALHEWTRHDSIAVRKTGGTGKNVLRVHATGNRLQVSVNGAEVAAVTVPDGATAGLFGFRVGRDVNLHVSTLDLTTHLAPPRP